VFGDLNRGYRQLRQGSKQGSKVVGAVFS